MYRLIFRIPDETRIRHLDFHRLDIAAQCGMKARECFVYVEIVDPETGEPVEM